MSKRLIIRVLLISLLSITSLMAQEELIQEFPLIHNNITLNRLAKPGIPFDKVGRRFAILGDESGSFEAWAYPLKLFRNFSFSFFVKESTRPIHASDIVRSISVSPEATILTYTYQSFTVKAIYVTSIDQSGAAIFLKVDSSVPLTIVCGFLPILQPMWPAGIGGQYAYWNNNLKAYILSEPTGKNHAIVGSPAASGISYTPAHMLSDTPSEFKIEIPDPKKIHNKYIPIYIAGGKGDRKSIQKTYEYFINNPEDLYLKTQEHYCKLRENTLRIKTPDKRLNLAFEWAKVAFDNLIVENPDLGKGLVAGLGASGTSGRPGFGWFFGGDTYINAFSINSYGDFNNVRDALAFTKKWQRSDGKMAHELSQAAGYIDWWKDYPYGYIHGDTTPYYIVAVYDYVKMSGDTEFLKSSWSSLKQAFEWCLSTDANRDGLMDNKKAGLGALEYGALTGIETDVYLAAIWTQATYSMQQLSKIIGDKASVKKAGTCFQKAKAAFDARFWDEETKFYSYAFNVRNTHVKDISPWNSLGLMWRLGTYERCLHSLEKLLSSDLNTDWGIRSISEKSSFFQPLNYNYGAVWPFLTSWVTTALYKNHMPLQGFTLLCATAQYTFNHGLGTITEVFSGTHHIWPQEAVAHQGFSSAGVILPFVRGLLGLEGDALNNKVFFAPQFPPNWEHVDIGPYKIGKARFFFKYFRTKDTIDVNIRAENAHGFVIHFSPALERGSKILNIKVNGSLSNFTIKTEGQVIFPLVEIPVDDAPLEVSMKFVPTLEICPVIPETKPGERNKGIKIISTQRDESTLRVNVEGLSGTPYALGVRNIELLESIEGAKVEGGELKFQIPGPKTGTFVSHTIAIQLKQQQKQ